MSTSLFAPDFLAIFNSNRDTGGPLKSFCFAGGLAGSMDLLSHGGSLQ